MLKTRPIRSTATSKKILFARGDMHFFSTTLKVAQFLTDSRWCTLKEGGSERGFWVGGEPGRAKFMAKSFAVLKDKSCYFSVNDPNLGAVYKV